MTYACPECNQEINHLRTEAHIPIQGIHVLSNGETIAGEIAFKPRDVKWDYLCPECGETVDPEDCPYTSEHHERSVPDTRNTLLESPEERSGYQPSRYSRRVSNDDSEGSIDNNDGRFLPANIQICEKCKSLFFATYNTQKCCSHC